MEEISGAIHGSQIYHPFRYQQVGWWRVIKRQLCHSTGVQKYNGHGTGACPSVNSGTGPGPQCRMRWKVVRAGYLRYPVQQGCILELLSYKIHLISRLGQLLFKVYRWRDHPSTIFKGLPTRMSLKRIQTDGSSPLSTLYQPTPKEPIK